MVLAKAYKEEEGYWSQKARVTWLKEGDKNSKFFHAYTIQRRKGNKIQNIIKSDGKVCTSTDEIEHEIEDYYHSLFRSSNPDLDHHILEGIPQSISTSMNQILTCQVEDMEIKKALFDLSPNKAPGMDGMSPLFFQHCWHFISNKFCSAVKDFFRSGKMLRSTNHTIITLIPKIKNPSLIAHFRPISLCGVVYKVISKIIVNRMKPVLHHCISVNQSAFIPGRQIIDNVVLTHECIHHLKGIKKGQKAFMALKLDMSKAYDRVEWKFLASVLTKMGFDCVFVNWILKCINSSSFSFNVNGQISGFCVPSRGIRQGDPLSPYLFILLSEVLSNLFKQAQLCGLFQGIKISRGGPVLTHLFFADDSIVFCEASLFQALSVRTILDRFCRASGQQVNLEKSAVMFSRNVGDDTKMNICALLNGITEHHQSRYLGLPMVIGRSKKEVFQFVIDSVQKRVNSWSNIFLSSAGKEVLLKAVINAMPNYVMSCFKLPIHIVKEICKISSKFWWGTSTSGGKKISWVAWDKMTLPKNKGGLGFQDLELFNEALLTKQLWRLISQPNLLISKVLRAKYYNKGGLLNCVAKSGDSWLWKSWLKSLKSLKLGLRHQVGNGKGIKIWEHPWLPKTPAFKPRSCKPVHCALTWVRDLMTVDGKNWNLDILKGVFCETDIRDILQISIDQDERNDKWIWHWDKKGSFLVKSAYGHLLKDRQIQIDRPESSAGASKLDLMWKSCWKLKVTNKIKHFLWKILHNCLPTAQVLVRRGISLDPRCPVCGDKEENVEHLFFHCVRAEMVWKLAPVRWNFTSHPDFNLKSWWDDNCVNSKGHLIQDRIQLSAFLLWWIWKARNTWIFDKCCWKDCDIVKFAWNDWNEFNLLSAHNKEEIKQPKDPTKVVSDSDLVAQSATVGHHVMVISAVNVEQQGSALGGWIANDQGQLLKAWANSREFIANPVEVVLLGIRMALCSASDSGLIKLKIMVDDKDIAGTLNKRLPFVGGGAKIAEDIYLLCFLFDHVFFLVQDLKFKLNCNRLARLAFDGEFCLNWVDQFPDWLVI